MALSNGRPASGRWGVLIVTIFGAAVMLMLIASLFYQWGDGSRIATDGVSDTERPVERGSGGVPALPPQ